MTFSKPSSDLGTFYFWFVQNSRISTISVLTLMDVHMQICFTDCNAVSSGQILRTSAQITINVHLIS